MKSKYNSIKENQGQPYKTKSYQNDKVIKNSIAQVAAFIHQHVISNKNMIDWKVKSNNGTFTFQNIKDTNRVITIFFDFDQILALKEGFMTNGDSIVLGIELTNEPSLSREIIRDGILKMYPNNYLDPRKNHNKYYIMPQTEHFYDIVILPPGNCDVNGQLVEEYLEKMNKKENENEMVDF